MDNQPVTTRRAILIQDFDDGTYGERLQVTRFDQTGVTSKKHQNNAA